MRFILTTIPDAYLVEFEPLPDERGSFTRTWCRREFASRGLNGHCVQCSVSYNAKRGTLRGLHYQASPYEEAKLVQVVRGAIHDVVLDLRSWSPAFHRWFATELAAGDRRALYVPEGCAHGFLTLADETEVQYQISEYYHAPAARGVRWDDRLLSGAWPERPAVISERDRGYADVA